MKVCKKLYSALLSLDCKDSIQQFRHPQLQGGTVPRGFSLLPWRRESQDDLLGLVCTGLGLGKGGSQPCTAKPDGADPLPPAPLKLAVGVLLEAADVSPAFTTRVPIPGTHGRGVPACVHGTLLRDRRLGLFMALLPQLRNWV